MITNVRAPYGWYYNACNQCGSSLRFFADKFWCTQQHGEKTPMLTYKLELTVEDPTGQIDIIAFGKQAEKLIGATIPELISINGVDKMVLPGPITLLQGETRTFQVGLTAKAIETNTVTFKLYDCDDDRKRKRKRQEETSSPHDKIKEEASSHVTQ